MARRDTYNDLLDAAEQLFAEKGYDAASVREITRLADANLSAVNYHFGDKESLLVAVTRRINIPLIERRFELLDAAEAAAAPDHPDLDAILDAFLRPDVELLVELSERRGAAAPRLMGRVFGDQRVWIQAMAEEQFAETNRRFVPAFAAAAGQDHDEAEWRWSKVLAVVVHTFATWPDEGVDDAGADLLLARLIAVCGGIFRAPLAR